MQPAVPDPAEIDAIFANGYPDAILFYSRQTAVDFFRVPELRSAMPEHSGIRILCLSEAVAEAVPVALKKASRYHRWRMRKVFCRSFEGSNRPNLI